MVAVAPCEASTSCPAEVTAHACRRQPLPRAWRQPAHLLRQPFLGRRRAQRQQQLVSAATYETASAAKWGPQAEADELAALMPLEQEPTKPEPRRPGYRSFTMDSCEFLVAESPDGQLDLQDVYVLDQDSDVFARPSTSGELPTGLRHYQAVEVGAEYGGNVLEGKPSKQWVYRVYLIPIKSQDPYELDLSQAYLLDDKMRSVSNLPIRWLAPEDTEPRNLRLRVRTGSILTVESVESLPSWEDVVRANQEGLSALSMAEKALLDQAADGLLSWDQVQELVGEEYVRLWKAEAHGDGGGWEGGMGQEPVPEPVHFASEKLEDNIDDNLKDFMAEYDDEHDSDYEDFDSPAVDY